jgi:hypothetical protein
MAIAKKKWLALCRSFGWLENHPHEIDHRQAVLGELAEEDVHRSGQNVD